MRPATITHHARARLGAAAAVLAVFAATLGCGSSDSGLGGYLGTWHYTQSTGTVTCGTNAPVNLPAVGNKDFEEGLGGAALVDVSVSQLDPFALCNFGYDVKATTATIRANQTCTLTTSDVVTPGSGQFTLLGPTSGEETMGATITLFDPTTAMLSTATCAYAMQATLTKVAKD